jgi:hypothetical protein
MWGENEEIKKALLNQSQKAKRGLIIIVIGTLLQIAGTVPALIKVPELNVEPGCRAAAKMGDGVDATLRQCLADEKSAREDLEKEWVQYSSALRERCVATTRLGSNPSYVEVLVCMQMGRDAAEMEKSATGRGQAR